MEIRRRSRRRRWMAFGSCVCLISLLLGAPPLLSSAPEKAVRVDTPTVEKGPGLPAVERRPEHRPDPSFDKGALRSRLGRIAGNHTGSYGVVVLDPASGKTVALNAGEDFMAASLAKLPVLLALYRAADREGLDLEDGISILPSDVQDYGTGVLYYRFPVGYDMTLRQCAFYLIKESDNTAWVMLERYLGRGSIEAALRAVGATDTDYGNTRTTPRDVLLMLGAIQDAGFTNPQLSGEMLDLMTDTSFEDRLPYLLPESTRTAHKIGSYGDTFSDAGIVFYKDGQKRKKHYFIVVMSENTTEGAARSAIQKMSLATYRALAEPGPEPPFSRERQER